MKHRGELAEYEPVFVYDHPYTGNVCSGFGGRIECRALNLDGRPCDASRWEHRTAKHRRREGFMERIMREERELNGA